MNAGAFFSALVLTALWVLWMEAWAGYFNDCLRARIAELRDRLLKLVADGRVDAGGPAYRRLRDQLDAAVGGPRRLLAPARLLLSAWRARPADAAPRPAGDPLSAIEHEWHAAAAGHVLRSSLLLWPWAILLRRRLGRADRPVLLHERSR